MSVFKEGYYAIQELQHNACQVYPDACDFGAPYTKGSRIFNIARNLTKAYGIPSTRTFDGLTSQINIHLMDEHGTGESEYFTVIAARTPEHRDYDGYIEVYKETDDTIIDQLECELAKQMEKTVQSAINVIELCKKYNSPEHNA